MFYGEVVIEDMQTGEKTVVQPSRVDFWGPPNFCEIGEEDFHEIGEPVVSKEMK